MVTGQTNRQAEARFTRLSTRNQTVRGVEIGTLADLRRLRRSSISTEDWKNGFAVLLVLSDAIAIERLTCAR